MKPPLSRLLAITFTTLLASTIPASADPIISEFLASNSTGITDQDGDNADWLELYNPDPTPVNLAGWYLTNKAGNLAKWTIPSVTLPSGGYLVVFCSSKNYTNPAQPLAANFNISESGGYLALVRPDGKSIASSYTFTAQETDVSYGVTQPADSGEAVQTGAFTVATPGAANGGDANLLLPAAITLSKPAGIFTGTTTVALGGATGTQHIRYVTAPASSAGAIAPVPTSDSPLYNGPITINCTTLLRAAVFTADDSQRGLSISALCAQLDNSTANRLDTFSSTMPLIVFDDHGFGLLPYDDTYRAAWTGAFFPGADGTATLTQAPDFFSDGKIKLHGYSSAYAPKQSYDADFSDDFGNDFTTPLFGMDSSKSWVSVANWNYDRTFIHDAFVYSVSNSMGNYASRTRFAEMFIHSAGGPLDTTSYAGVTTLADRLKVTTDRINIYSIADNDITTPNVTGGYVLRIDHPADDLFSWTTTQGVAVMLDTPSPDVLVKPQSDYITHYVQQMEDAMVADQAGGYATRNYLNFIDRPSWVDYHLLNVFVQNDDGFQFSEYFTKDVNGLIKAGPVWDYDRSMGSADGRDGNPQQWSPFYDVDFWNIGWWSYVTHDPDFMQAWVDRWQNLRLTLLSNGALLSRVNSLAAQIDPAAAARDAARWPDDASRYPGGWSDEIGAMTTWLESRAQWIDSQFVAPPIATSISATEFLLTPPPGTQIAYTLDGSDPRKSGGGLSATALLGTGPVTLSASQNFQARSYNASAVGVYPGSPWSSPLTAATITLPAVASTGQLANVSTRVQLGNASTGVVNGFVVTGPDSASNQVLVRGVGPTLSQLGVGGVLAQPVLTVFDSTGRQVATNTDWSTNADAAAVATAAASVGAFALPSGSADSALLLGLAPGSYTMKVSASGLSGGIVLGELYEMLQSNTRIANVSCRANVNPGAGILVSGFVISGGPATVLVRGDGPALAQFGVNNLLSQPVLQVFDSRGSLIASNTGWATNASATQVALAATVAGAFPLATAGADSAVLLTLPPGAYTMQISGLGATSGNALAESYLVPTE